MPKRNITLIKEADIKVFLKASTPEDVETFFNSQILMRKHLDGDQKKDVKYGVKLIDRKPATGTSYEVGSNAVGVESIRRLTRRHKIENGGSQSDTSKFIVFYSFTE